jgi:hypothetical protein
MDSPIKSGNDGELNPDNPIAESAGWHEGCKSFMAAPLWAVTHRAHLNVFRRYTIISKKHKSLRHKCFDVLMPAHGKSNGFFRFNIEDYPEY